MRDSIKIFILSSPCTDTIDQCGSRKTLTDTLIQEPIPHSGGANRPVFSNSKELYAKVILRPLTSLKTRSKCSFTPCKLRFFAHFCLVMKHNLTFAFTSKVILKWEGKGSRSVGMLVLVVECPVN
uniref:Uncharacterized protein n=1 Tax=Candidatus Kentrum sp. DK TaxID=2126562 RepID=A0A450T7D5_9GAMM|nr:MAG: hypothetical protein BECKDK2373B_GA0170837_11106 [Candidatus Kentron sp. DK]